MPVKYIDVAARSDLFVAATRAYGDIAVVGNASDAVAPTPIPAKNTPMAFTDPVTALATFPGDVGNSISMAFQQSPGPSKVWGVRIDTANATPWATALAEVAKLQVQIVALANTAIPVTGAASNASAIAALQTHVTSLSGAGGGDGKERIGVAMLPSGSTDITQVTASDRMVYVAHIATAVGTDPLPDAAAAVAGVIAGYEPHISILLKPVNIHQTTSFADSDIDTFDAHGINWFVHPTLIPGTGIYMGEGYTGDPASTKKYVDIVRTLDDITFRIKAELIQSIGNFRVSRTGLRALVTITQAVLAPLQALEVIEGFSVYIPLLVLLDKDPTTLTATELQEIQTAQADRRVDMTVICEYAGAIHRLHIDLIFK